MGTNGYMRASDHDRDQAAELLCDAYTVGRLSHEEFDERLMTAYSARTWGELRDLTADLPAPPAAGLPSDIAARREPERKAAHRMCVRMIMTCLLVLAAGIAEWNFSGLAWLVALTMIVAAISLTHSTGRR